MSQSGCQVYGFSKCCSFGGTLMYELVFIFEPFGENTKVPEGVVGIYILKHMGMCHSNRSPFL